MSDPIITNINKAMIQLQTEDRIEQLERELRLAKVQIGNLDKLNTDKAIGLGEKYREIADLRAKLEAAERDAARYRWLRSEAINFGYDTKKESPWVVFGSNASNCAPICGNQLDAELDAILVK